MSLSKKVFSNTMVQILARGVTTVIGVITLKLITSYGGPDTYGDYTYVIQYLTVFGIFVDMGLFTIGVREMSKDQEKRESILGNLMTLRVMIATIVLGIGIVLAYIQGYNEHVFTGIIVMTFATFFTYMESTIKTVLQCKLMMEYHALSFTISRIVAVLYVYYTVVNDLPFYHLLLGGLYGSIVNVLITYFFVVRFIHVSFRFDKEYMKDITIKALPFGLALIVNVIYFRIGALLLYNIEGSEALGIYGVPLKILDIMVFIPPLFMNSVLPILSKYIKENNHEKINASIQKSWDFLYMSGLPIAIGISLLAPYVIKIVSSEEFLEAKFALWVLMGALFASFLNTLFGFVLVALNRQIYLFWINFINVVLNTFLNFILIYDYSYNGVAVAALVSEVLVLFMTMFYAYKFYHYSIRIMNTIKITISALFMSIVVYYGDIYLDLFNWKYLSLVILISGIIYIMGLIITRALNKELIGYKN